MRYFRYFIGGPSTRRGEWGGWGVRQIVHSSSEQPSILMVQDSSRNSCFQFPHTPVDTDRNIPSDPFIRLVRLGAIVTTTKFETGYRLAPRSSTTACEKCACRRKPRIPFLTGKTLMGTISESEKEIWSLLIGFFAGQVSPLLPWASANLVDGASLALKHCVPGFYLRVSRWDPAFLSAAIMMMMMM